MSKVLCKHCKCYDYIIHSCARLDKEAGGFVSYVFDDCWCDTDDGAIPMTTKQEFYLAYGPCWRAYKDDMEDDMDIKDIENRFTYHAPKEGQVELYESIRYVARDFATCINDLCPDSREKSLAITKLEETVMWANASIARAE